MRDPAQLADNKKKAIEALEKIYNYLETYWNVRTNTNGFYTPTTLWDGPRWSPIAYSVIKEAHAEMQKIETYLSRLETQSFFDISEELFDFLFKQLISSGYRIKGFRPSLSLKLDILFGTSPRNLNHLQKPKKCLTCEEPIGVYFYADFQPYANLANKQQERMKTNFTDENIESINEILENIRSAVEHHKHQKVSNHINELKQRLKQEPKFENHELFEELIDYLQMRIGSIGGWIRDVRGSDIIIGFIPSVEEGLRFLLGTLRKETHRFLKDDKDRHFGWNIGAALGSAKVLLGYWLPVEAIGSAAKFVEKAEEARHVVGGRSTILCSRLGRKAKHTFGNRVDMQEYARDGYFTTTSEI